MRITGAKVIPNMLASKDFKVAEGDLGFIGKVFHKKNGEDEGSG